MTKLMIFEKLCLNNNWCDKADLDQYARLTNFIDDWSVHNLAMMVWILTSATTTVRAIENELVKAFTNAGLRYCNI